LQIKQQEDVYDEVDEDVYRSVVRGRLAEDEFIEEDQGVSGYADNGMDDWDREERSESDDDEDGELSFRTLYDTEDPQS
jgi:DNA polymerase alpha subunit A